MIDPVMPGTVARIRTTSRNGGPLTWIDPVNGPVSLYPGESVTIGNQVKDETWSIHDYYYFGNAKLSKPMVISSWQFTPLSECGDGTQERNEP